MEYYSAIRKNDYPTFAATWMGLEEIMLSEISQAEKDNYHKKWIKSFLKMSFSRWKDKSTGASRQCNIIQHFSRHEKTWQKLKCILLSEREGYLRRLHTVWFKLYDTLEKVKLMETVKRSVAARDLDRQIRGFGGQWKYSV